MPGGFSSHYARTLYVAECADTLEAAILCPVCGDERFTHSKNSRTGRVEGKYSCGLILEIQDGGGLGIGSPCRGHELDWLRAVATEARDKAEASAAAYVQRTEGGADIGAENEDA